MRDVLTASLIWLSIVLMGRAANPSEDEAWRSKASAGEIELVDLMTELQVKYDGLYDAMENIEDPRKRRDYIESHDPIGEYIPKLLAIEKKNRGTRLGLLACRRVILLAGASGLPDAPESAGRREILKQLDHYVNDPLSIEFIRYLDAGCPEPDIIAALKTQIGNEEANPAVRDACRLILAQYYLMESGGREYTERRLKELEAGDKPRSPFEREDLGKSLEDYPEWETIRNREAEAVVLLKHLVAANAEHRLPLVTGVDPGWNLIRPGEGPNTNPRLAEIADGILFKEMHLKVGKPAPDLKLPLLDGRDWSLSEQKGRVVIIQFSFKGCGPCEAMYPDLRELTAAYPKDLSVLSITRDKEKQDAIEAVASGTMTWHVSWDGYRGPTTTRWGVDSYPTVYIIDKQGLVAARDLRGEQLKQKVAKLISANKKSTGH
jgi:thiol-disulfide isomerase/thioredoxin